MKSYVVALLAGVVISLGLFGLMQLMLMSSQQTIKKAEPVTMMDFIRLKREPPEKPKVKPPEKKAEPVQDKPQPPKTPPKKQPVIQKTVVKQEVPHLDAPKFDAPKPDIPVSAVKSTAPVVNAPAPRVAAEVEADTGKAAAATSVNTGVIPLERVPPKYPMRAAKRHIEGWVKIEFTITTGGDVENAVVVEAQPAEIFDDAALQAISQWKFKGKVVDGVAVTQRAVQTLQFKLAK